MHSKDQDQIIVYRPFSDGFLMAALVCFVSAGLMSACGGSSNTNSSTNTTGNGTTSGGTTGGGTTTTSTGNTTTGTVTTTTGTTKCANATVSLNAATGLAPGMDELAKYATITRSGSNFVIKSKSVPNHKSPYFQTTDSRYTAGPSTGFVINPSRISDQNYVLTIPVQPTCASNTTDTSLDAIGIASNGVVFFNQYAAGNSPLTSEIISFDQYNGHPAQQGNYHYHLEPKYITASSSTILIGWALDGFPVYGPKNPDGSTPTLDKCNGEFGVTPEFPQGIYHYHATSAAPYLVGCYAGTPGTKSN